MRTVVGGGGVSGGYQNQVLKVVNLPHGKWPVHDRVEIIDVKTIVKQVKFYRKRKYVYYSSVNRCY